MCIDRNVRFCASDCGRMGVCAGYTGAFAVRCGRHGGPVPDSRHVPFSRKSGKIHRGDFPELSGKSGPMV